MRSQALAARPRSNTTAAPAKANRRIVAAPQPVMTAPPRRTKLAAWAVRARDTLACLSPPHRAALTLRYLDDLPVPEVADFLERTVHATEALLVRARSAFRRAYEAGEDLDG